MAGSPIFPHNPPPCCTQNRCPPVIAAIPWAGGELRRQRAEHELVRESSRSSTAMPIGTAVLHSHKHYPTIPYCPRGTSATTGGNRAGHLTARRKRTWLQFAGEDCGTSP